MNKVEQQRFYRTGCALALLFMILSRLIWLQLRTFSNPENKDFWSSLLELDSLDRGRQGSCAILARLLSTNKFPGKEKIVFSNFSSLSRENIHAFVLRAPATWMFQETLCMEDHLRDGEKIWAEEEFLKWNLRAMIVLIFFCCLITRMLTGSWLISLLVAVMLLSRGSVLNKIGEASFHLPVSLSLTAFFTFCIYFFRTFSQTSFWAYSLCLLLLIFLKPQLYALGLMIPICSLLSSYVYRFSPLEQGSSLRLSFLRPLCFSSFLSSKMKDLRKKYALQTLGLSLLVMLGLFFWNVFLGLRFEAVFSDLTVSKGPSIIFSLEFWSDFFSFSKKIADDLQKVLSSFLNFHLLVSFAVLIFTGVRLFFDHSYRIISEFSLYFLILISLSVLSCLSYPFFVYLIQNVFFYQGGFHSYRQNWFLSDLLSWLEPMILTMGLCGAYEIFQKSRAKISSLFPKR
ncbi:MAG: hypothetical protein KA436_00685 [Oligoflexales bacterium]|nr:hypothetical protein [Oligoflexales bacterium]